MALKKDSKAPGSDDAIRLALAEAEMALREGDVDRAKRRLRDGLRYAPANPELHFRLAEIFYHEDLYHDASRLLTRAAEQAPHDHRIVGLLGDVMFERYEEGEEDCLEPAIAALAQSLQRADDASRAWTLAEAILRQGHRESAIGLHRNNANRHPDHQPTWIRLLVLARQDENEELEAEAAEQLERLAPNHYLLT